MVTRKRRQNREVGNIPSAITSHEWYTVDYHRLASSSSSSSYSPPFLVYYFYLAVCALFLFLRLSYRLTDSALEKRFGVISVNDLILGGPSSVIGMDTPDDVVSESRPLSLGSVGVFSSSNSLLSPKTLSGLMKQGHTNSNDVPESQGRFIAVYVYVGDCV